MTDDTDQPKPDAARPRNPEDESPPNDESDDLEAGGGMARDDDDLDADASLPGAAQGHPLPLRSVAIVVLVVFAAMAFALQPGFSGSIAVWAIMGTAYCGLGLYAVLLLKRAGTLKDRLSFRPGDASVGIVLGLGLAGAGLVAQRLLAPDGSNGALWLLQLYEVAGDFQTNGPLIALLVLVSALEELVWRGLVQDTLTSVRPRSAPALTALAYTVSVAPSAILLTSDVAGPNPLLLFAALGCGLVWSYARIVLPRLFPVMVSHMVFTYFMAAPLPHWF